MPSDRSTGSEPGLAVRCCSNRVMLSPPPPPRAVAHAATNAAAAAMTKVRTVRILRLLPVRIEHVFEPHPTGIEIQVNVPRAAVPILAHQELGGAFDAAGALVHL